MNKHDLEGLRVRCPHDGHNYFGVVRKGVCSECGCKVEVHCVQDEV